MRRVVARLQDAVVTEHRSPSKAAQWLACMLNVGLVTGAVCVVAAEGWDLNRDGAFTVHEALHVPHPASWTIGWLTRRA